VVKLPPGAERKPDGSITYEGHTFPGVNKPITSWAEGKKKAVMALKDGEVKLVHFGAEGYGHNYSAAARENYLARSAGIRGKDGALTKDDPHSPNYWARKSLWAGEGGSKKEPEPGGPRKAAKPKAKAKGKGKR
jgi:hypothetical protein